VSDTSVQTEPVYASASPASRGGGGGILGPLALLLSLLALGAAGYLFYRTDMAQQNQMTQQVEAAGVSSQVASVEKNFDGVKEDFDKVEAKVDKVGEDLTAFKGEVSEDFIKIRSEEIAEIKKAQSEGANQIGEMQANIDKVFEEIDESRGGMELKEVEDLLVTANTRLRLSGNIEVASTALSIADERVGGMNDPGLADIRAKIAEETAALGALEKVDVTGLASRVRALHDVVDSLPLKEEPRLMGSPEEEAGVKPADDDKPAADGDSAEEGEAGIKGWLKADKWKSIGGEVAKDLGSHIKIQRNQEARAPLMSPDQRFFLFQNLKLLLNSSQVSLLQSDQDGYRGNLERAGEWLGEYFVADAAPVQNAAAEIKDLAGAEVAQELPDISGSLRELRKVIKRFLIIAFLIAYWLFRWLGMLRRAPKNVKKANKTRAVARAHASTSAGYASLIEGNWNKAEKQLMTNIGHNPSPMPPSNEMTATLATTTFVRRLRLSPNSVFLSV